MYVGIADKPFYRNDITVETNAAVRVEIWDELLVTCIILDGATLS